MYVPGGACRRRRDRRPGHLAAWRQRLRCCGLRSGRLRREGTTGGGAALAAGVEREKRWMVGEWRERGRRSRLIPSSCGLVGFCSLTFGAALFRNTELGPICNINGRRLLKWPPTLCVWSSRLTANTIIVFNS